MDKFFTVGFVQKFAVLTPSGNVYLLAFFKDVIGFSVKIEGLENSSKIVLLFSRKHVLVLVKRSTVLKSTMHYVHYNLHG